MLRWSTTADAERLAELVALGNSEVAGARAGDHGRRLTLRLLRGGHPFAGPDSFAVVEDLAPRVPRLVACAVLYEHVWRYEDVTLAVGRPEFVNTLPHYRRRGLMRAVMEALHARSARAEHVLQAITGDPFVYRLLGYDYALDLEDELRLAVPTPRPGEELQVRPGTPADLSLVERLHAQSRRESIVWAQLSRAHWRHQLAASAADAATGEVRVLTDPSGATRGIAVLAPPDDARLLCVRLLELDREPVRERTLGAALAALAAGRAAEGVPIDKVALHVGRTHPAHALLAGRPGVEPVGPYAWYVRVPSLIRLLQRIEPVLERRLAAAGMSNRSTHLTLDVFRCCLRLWIEHGRLARVEPVCPAGDTPATSAAARFPPGVFAKLLLGYRSLLALEQMFPDVSVNDEGRELLTALFPVRQSFVMVP